MRAIVAVFLDEPLSLLLDFPGAFGAIAGRQNCCTMQWVKLVFRWRCYTISSHYLNSCRSISG